uniref:Zn(2)-C6 fungal-type domain-containing protein n=1 Tax=Guillardia theta TaxID=55529 RepID=A0A7S4NM91_GUITH|mmetsp:Transcript_26360/g.86639  ORF Transcript_26360/g.86639 Transcript_26360/m.86639 type:complete len:200 (+) Transcript_26360:202-801(+)
MKQPDIPSSSPLPNLAPVDELLPFVPLLPSDVQSFVSSSGTSYLPSDSDDPKPSSQRRARLACRVCKQRKMKCDDLNPCSRCLESSADCVRDGVLPPEQPAEKKRGRNQTKQACTYCRERKMKCEAQRPCWRCVRVGNDCTNGSPKITSNRHEQGEILPQLDAMWSGDNFSSSFSPLLEERLVSEVPGDVFNLRYLCWF